MIEGPINTLATPGEFDALSKLRADEPYFLLLGRDRSAPALVQLWADGNRKKAFAEHDAGTLNDNDLERELRQSTDAERIGWAMKTYKRGEERDAVSGQLSLETSYTGYNMPVDVAKREAEQRVRSRAIRAIHNAIAEANDAIPALQDVGALVEIEAIESTIAMLKATVTILTPKRPGVEVAA